MNFPNTLTILRILLTFCAVALVCTDVRYCALAAFFVYVVAGSTDWFDGYLARKYNAVTVFGKFMDALSDKIMVVAMFMTLFALDMYRDWTLIALVCAIASVTREFAVSGIRMVASNAGIVLAAEKMGKYKAAFQMYSVGAIILAFAMKVDFGTTRGFVAEFAYGSGIATLLLSTVLSVWSGLGYIRRYGHLLKG